MEISASPGCRHQRRFTAEGSKAVTLSPADNPSHHDFRAFGRLPIIDGVGMTEACMVMTTERKLRTVVRRDASVGRRLHAARGLRLLHAGSGTADAHSPASPPAPPSGRQRR